MPKKKDDTQTTPDLWLLCAKHLESAPEFESTK